VTDSKRFDDPFECEFGGQVITAAPLKGLARIKAFETAVKEEVYGLQQRVIQFAREAQVSGKVSAEALLENGVDQVRLLKLGLPDVITDELLDESTARERHGLLVEICKLNDCARYSLFLMPEMLLEVASNLNQKVPAFPINGSKPSSLRPDSAGSKSNEN
jgi:hypothetical protein